MLHSRYLRYLLIGLVFGIVDWYYLVGLGRFPWQNILGDATVPWIAIPLIIGLNYGIWLVPVIPIAIFEVRRSQSVLRAAMAAVLTWCAAIFAYYAYYTLLLTFVGLPNMDFLLFGNRQSPTYWSDWMKVFNRVILAQFAEWVVVAVVGGAIVGAGCAGLYGWWTRRRALVRTHA